MTVQELKKLVEAGEGQHIEFKKKIHHIDKLLKEIVAFSNADGGTLLVGVQDNKLITGVKDTNEVISVLTKAITELIKPKIRYHFNVVPVTLNRNVVSLSVLSSRCKPHYVLPITNSGKRMAYYRFGEKSIQASHELLKVIKFRTKSRNGYLLIYSDDVRRVLQFLNKRRSGTLASFSEFAGLNTPTASRTLVDLVLANVLKLIPRDNEDLYVLNDRF